MAKLSSDVRSCNAWLWKINQCVMSSNWGVLYISLQAERAYLQLPLPPVLYLINALRFQVVAVVLGTPSDPSFMNAYLCVCPLFPHCPSQVSKTQLLSWGQGKASYISSPLLFKDKFLSRSIMPGSHDILEPGIILVVTVSLSSPFLAWMVDLLLLVITVPSQGSFLTWSILPLHFLLARNRSFLCFCFLFFKT